MDNQTTDAVDASEPNDAAIPAAVVEATIQAFTDFDESGDKRTMNRMARRLGKEQPQLLSFAAKCREVHGDKAGEAAVFYGTLVWAVFDRHHDGCDRLTANNFETAGEEVDSARNGIEESGEFNVTQIPQVLLKRQEHLYTKLIELIEEDIREDAMSEEIAAAILVPTQVIIEAFDAAASGKRPGERIGPIVRDQPKIGRNEPCPCGSGKKYKKCCGKN